MDSDLPIKILGIFGVIALNFFLYAAHRGSIASERKKRLAEQQLEQQFLDNLKQEYKLDIISSFMVTLRYTEKKGLMGGVVLDKHSEKIIIIEDSLPKFYSFSELFDYRIYAKFDIEDFSISNVYKNGCILEKEEAEKRIGSLKSMVLDISFKDSNRVKHSHEMCLFYENQPEYNDCTEEFNRVSVLNDYLTNIFDNNRKNKQATRKRKSTAQQDVPRPNNPPVACPKSSAKLKDEEEVKQKDETQIFPDGPVSVSVPDDPVSTSVPDAPVSVSVPDAPVSISVPDDPVSISVLGEWLM